MSTNDLPIPGFDRLSVDEVEARVADLPASQVDALIAAEELHGGRMPVLKLLYSRRDELAGGVTATPGEPGRAAPDPAAAPERSDPDDLPRGSGRAEDRTADGTPSGSPRTGLSEGPRS